MLQNSEGNPFSGGVKYTGLENFAAFDRNCLLSHKRHEISPWLLVLWITNRLSYVADRSLSVPITLSELKRRKARDLIFWRISVITLLSFDLEQRWAQLVKILIN